RARSPTSSRGKGFRVRFPWGSTAVSDRPPARRKASISCSMSSGGELDPTDKKRIKKKRVPLTSRFQSIDGSSLPRVFIIHFRQRERTVYANTGSISEADQNSWLMRRDQPR